MTCPTERLEYCPNNGWACSKKYFEERMPELERRIAKVNGLLMDNYPCYDEDKCKNCKGDFGEIDYRTCIGYNILRALRGETQSASTQKEEVKQP